LTFQLLDIFITGYGAKKPVIRRFYFLCQRDNPQNSS